MQDYEVKNMTPSDRSAEVSQATIEYINKQLPNIPGLNCVITNVALCFLDLRTRRSMR